MHLCPELCTLPIDAGPCFDSLVQWRYDADTRACVSFMYTGCNGNANRFASIEECERACGDYRDQSMFIIIYYSLNRTNTSIRYCISRYMHIRIGSWFVHTRTRKMVLRCDTTRMSIVYL